MPAHKTIKDPPHSLPNGKYYDLGTYTRAITANHPEARKWFMRGLLWCYGFNHEAAIECFETAIAHDPRCVMAHWGLAYSLGPNYNMPWALFSTEQLGSHLKRAYEAVSTAKKHYDEATPIERSLIDSLSQRYQAPKVVDDLENWNKDYSDAMKQTYDQFPNDLDVAALYAESLMNLTPWKLWDLHTGKPPAGARTYDAKAVLDNAFNHTKGAHQHPGLLHLYIHLMEMSTDPSSALNIANALRGLVPDSGHLNHMTTHLDILCGDYDSAIIWNQNAILADNKYLDVVGAQNFYSLYRAHNFHFRIYAAMFAARFHIAMETTKHMEAALSEIAEGHPLAIFLEGMQNVRTHVLIRFGRWEEVLRAISLPSNPEKFYYTAAMTHYGHGIAHSALGNISAAEEAREAFRKAKALIPEDRMLFNNKCIDVAGIASEMLDGELEYRRGNIEESFKHLRLAIEKDSRMAYEEPWPWMHPPRHAYGALLLEQDRVKEALAVYRADLGLDGDEDGNQGTLPRALQHRGNVWALQGLKECLERLGEDSGDVKRLLDEKKAKADVSVDSSCFCRRGKEQVLDAAATNEKACCV